MQLGNLKKLSMQRTFLSETTGNRKDSLFFKRLEFLTNRADIQREDCAFFCQIRFIVKRNAYYWPDFIFIGKIAYFLVRIHISKKECKFSQKISYFLKDSNFFCSVLFSTGGINSQTNRFRFQ